MIAVRSASLYADEGSPYWQCDIELLDARDYGRLPRDTAFEIEVFGIVFAMVVDTRELRRSIDDAGNYASVARIAGLSPVCRHASPRATPITKTWDAPIMASAACAELVGAVDWAMVDWMIPAHRLAATDAAPLDVARNLVAAAGGLLESLPDGTLRARPKWSVSVPDFAPAPTDHLFSDRDLFGADESPINDALVNRVRIVDVEGAHQDRLEFVADQNDALRGEIRVFPSPWRGGLTLRHTRGSPPVYLDAAAEGSESQTETVEFVAGQASVRYPIAALGSVEWMAENLGAVAFEPFSSALVAGGPDGYSLARVTYTTRFLLAKVRASAATDAQFVLEDSGNG